MAQDVKMPQMGESIAEGTVTTWLKKVGDRVERDEPLFEISTDKVDAEIPSPVAGTLLEIKAQPGETVPIHSVVAVIGDAAEGSAKAPATFQRKAAPAQDAPGQSAAKQAPPKSPDKALPAKPAAAAKPAPSPQASHGAAPTGAPADSASVDERRRSKSSPLVRKIAAEHSVDITALQGSGISGRVTKQDILAHLEGHDAAPAAARAAPAAGPGRAQSLGDTPIPEAYRPRELDGDRVEELSTMRAKISEHMVLSRRISAHVGTVFEVDFSHVAALRAKYKGAWEERFGVNLTFTSFIMKATVDALKAFPLLNASIDGRKVIYHRDVNLGLAVALEWGLIVPVVHKADELNLLGLARRAADLAGRARTKKLKPEEVQAGTFTITNPGIYGPMFGIPVINQPQVAILGVGTVEKRPVVVDDMIAIRTRAYLSMSFDHRLIDGAIADQFMARIKKGIEEFDPSQM